MNNHSKLLINLQRAAEHPALPENLLREAAEAALLAEQQTAVELTIRLTTNGEVQQLNKQFRGKDKPTNVLSFPDGTETDGVAYLGDIALALETLEHEAKEQGKTIEAHTQHLVVHGVLHLLGYDHETEEEATEMEAREVDILAKMRLQNPYV